MSAAQHTPGPWEVHHGLDYICVLRPGDDTGSAIQVDNARDAHLIATAPELLAVLQEAVERPIITEGDAWWGRVGAAIAKATGSAPALFDKDNALMMNESDAKALGGGL